MTDQYQYQYSNSTGTLTKFLCDNTTTTAALDARLIIHNVSVNAPSKRTLSFTIKAWATIKDVKDQIFARLAIPTSVQRLYLAGPLQNYSQELPNHWTLHDASITQTHASQQDLFLIDSRSLSSSSSSSSSTYPYNNTPSLNSISIAISMKKYTPKPLFDVLQRTRAGFAAGFKPVLVLDGSGGTYFLHDAYKAKIAVFKPADEEPYAPNNPRGYVNTNQPTRRATPFLNNNNYSPFFQDDDDDDLQQQKEGPIISLRAGIHPGESCLREVAAYLLDHDRFSGVPMTTLVQAKHEGFHISGSRLKVYEGGASIGPHSTTPTSDDPRPTKIGSFQQFVLAECSMDDLSPSMISVEEVQKIAILDIRLMNADRNSANLLCRRKCNTNQLELVPIDHGYCLRSVCDVSWFDWCWLDWPQVKEPLSTRMKEYVNNLNIEQDVQILKDVLKIRPKALDFFRASSMLLQAGVRAGLCLYDIAHLCCRNDNNGEVPSKLEMLIEKSFELAISAVENGKWHHSAASRALEHQLATCNSPEEEEEEPAYKNRLSSPFRSKRVLLKSASSVDLSEEKRKADVSGATLFAAYQRQHDSIHSLPDSENTSGSDSDSCCCDVRDDTIADSDYVVSSQDLEQDDHDDCEQWAASVIADVSLDPPARNRSFSDSSSSNGGESNLSQSPAGFWQVRPGSIRTSTTRGHLKSVSWSALDSQSGSCSSMVNNYDGAPNNNDDDDVISNSESPTSVTNAVLGLLASAGNGTISPISSLSTPKTILSPPTSLQERQKTSEVMKRSQSYCALSLAPASGSRGKNINISKSAIRGGNKCSTSLLRSNTADHDQLHEYYLKFIDLLITREIIGIANKKL